MTRYLITLSPLGKYFFGGEVTFGGENDKTNYLVRSNILPQATALMGLVRYWMLASNGLLSYNAADEWIRSKVNRLIGESSADVGTPSDSYGVIKCISPVFLTDDCSDVPESCHYYTPMPLDYYNPVTFLLERCAFKTAKKVIPIIEGFDWKTYDTWQYWCDQRGDKLADSPFVFSEQIGINKNERSPEDDNDAFFKQTLVTLRDGFRFVFTAEIDEEAMNYGDSPLDEGTFFVPFGGNRSMFSMKVRKISGFKWENIFMALHRDGRLVCLGDAKLSEEDIVSCDFIWGENKPFRSIVNSIDKNVSWDRPKKSRLSHLLSRGSVIFATSDRLDALKKKTNLNNLGLNIFI